MKVLILGGAGQDGKYLGEFLKLEKSVHVVIAARRIPRRGEAHFIEGIDYLILDITKQQDVEKILDLLEPDVILNLASISSVLECEQSPDISRLVNEIAPIQIMEFLRISGRNETRFIQASSSEMYSNSRLRIIDENTEVAPNNNYGRQKGNVHLEICQRQLLGENTSSLILFNHESPLRSPKFVSKKIITHVNSLKNGRPKKVKYGNLESSRDWGYAGDYMEAIASIILSKNTNNFVIGSGELHTIKEFYDLACSKAGIPDPDSWLEVDSQLFRKNDTVGLVANNSKIKSEIGWSPKTSFQELVERLLKADDTGTMNL